MMDIAITLDELLIAIIILIYIILLFIAIGKYHNCLTKMKRDETNFKLNVISKDEFHTSIIADLLLKSKLKLQAYRSISLLGLLHLSFAIMRNSYIITSLLILLAALVLLSANYLVKASNANSYAKNT